MWFWLGLVLLVYMFYDLEKRLQRISRSSNLNEKIEDDILRKIIELNGYFVCPYCERRYYKPHDTYKKDIVCPFCEKVFSYELMLTVYRYNRKELKCD